MDNKELQDKQYVRMTETPIPRLVGALAVPTTISMLVTNIYNLVDTAFVGKLGTSASGAVGVVFGYMAILQACGFMFGQGSGSIVARLLGRRDIDGASRYASTGFFGSLVFGAVISILSRIFLDPLIMVLGSTETILPYAKTYITYILIAAPFLTSSLTLNNLLRYEGRAKLGTVGLMTGAVLNICGDAVFMFGCHMGIAGAGLSTAVSQIISFSILLTMFLTGRTQSKLSIKYIFIKPSGIGNILATGFPSLIRQGLGSVSTILLNSEAAVYGDAAVSAMSIVSRISFFVMSLAIGIGQGYQPVGSFNYGAGKYGRVRQAYMFAFEVAEVFLIVLAVPVIVFAEPIVRLFRDDAQVVVYAVRALRLHCIALTLVPLTMITEMGFQSVGQKAYASVLSSMRSGILFIPTLWILSRVRGIAGIQEAQPAAFVMSFVVSLFFSRVFMRILSEKETLNVKK
ncbi:MAG: MATE family efflux transporter [Coprococcus sp.]